MLFIDVVCIAYQGNIVDAAMLAITAALQNSQSAHVIFGLAFLAIRLGL